MNFTRRIELLFGIATLVVSFAATVLVEMRRIIPGFEREQFLGIAVYLAPALLVFLGSHFDAGKRKTFGLIILWVGGLILTMSSFAGIFGGGLYVYGLSGGLAMASPSAPAIASMIASMLARRSSNNTQAR